MTLDKRAKKLAELIINYSVDLKPGENFLAQGEYAFREFLEYIGDFAKEKGAREVIYDFGYIENKRDILLRDDEKEMERESKRVCGLADWADARVILGSNTTTKENPFEGATPEQIGKYNSIVARPFLEKMGEKKWNVLGFPCEIAAKRANMKLSDYEDFVYGACLVDWKAEKGKMKKVKDIFDKADNVRIVAPKTDLEFSLKGRGGDICCGNYNMPDGEVYYGPVEDSLNGEIFFPYNYIREGNEVKGIWLKYFNGEVIDFSAEKNGKFLETMLDLPGVKRVGEFGIGCNPGIKKYMQNLLFDEKIGGTIHLALGNSYDELLSDGGGLNKADIHWDIVCDLRKVNGLSGGEIYADDKLVQKNGKFLF